MEGVKDLEMIHQREGKKNLNYEVAKTFSTTTDISYWMLNSVVVFFKKIATGLVLGNREV